MLNFDSSAQALLDSGIFKKGINVNVALRNSPSEAKR
jgi:hypothetical protein